MFDNIDNMALDSAVAFAKAEFGTSVEVARFDEKIPNTRAPYHVPRQGRCHEARRGAGGVRTI